MNAFITVAEQGSFAKAAGQLGVSASTVSVTIRTLENHLGVRLFNRTTRSVALTEVGERLLAQLRPLLAEYVDVVESVYGLRDKPAGVLRILAHTSSTHFVLAPMLADFLAEYPEITLDICTDPSKEDIVAERFDVGIRYRGDIPHDMIAVRISDDLRGCVVGSPDYFAGHSRPTTPDELVAHNCIRLRNPQGVLIPWRFEKDGDSRAIMVRGSLIFNEVTLLVRAASDAIGLAFLPLTFISPMIESGRLIPVLQDWAPRTEGIYLYYPSGRQIPGPLRALINFAKRNLEGKQPATVQARKKSVEYS